jgi:UDP-N-acetylmuramyl pentapeptide phosphotransferase/UDP-N-acetylglucosamine-1-phosphate transferase
MLQGLTVFNTETAAIATGLVAFTIAILIVVTKEWHGHLSMDGTSGVQKFHTSPTPRVGGVAIGLSLIVGYLLAASGSKALLGPLLLAGTPAFVFGLIEDLTKQVSVRTRLIATMSSGVLGWYITGYSITDVNLIGLNWILNFGVMSVLFTAFAVGGIANSINIIDGFNGLAAGTVTIILTSFGLIAVGLGDHDMAYTSLILAGAVLGFGMVNWPLGRIFLGDGGAYFVGFAIAWMAVLMLARHPEVSAWAPLLVCGYPVLEVMFSIIRRRRRGLSPGAADRLHLHSLIKRRVVRSLLPSSSNLVRNSTTGALMWFGALIPICIAVNWFKSTIILALGFLACALLYMIVYARLSQFRWCFRSRANSGRSISPTKILNSSPAASPE